MKNSIPLTKKDLDALFDEDALYNIKESWSGCGVSIDSRSIESGNLFLCLKGEVFDAHTKIADAIEKGASACLVESTWFEENKKSFPNESFIVVKSILRALGEIAQLNRLRFDIPVIAVAGSNGKTTTKEFIAHLLSSQYNVLKTKKNYNNQVGVPLMLLALTEEHQVAVIEIGTNEPGEIDTLSRMLIPTHGIITNIGKEHLEKLIDLDGVELEETYLFGFLKKHDGLAFINFDDERLRKYSRVLEKYISFGESEHSDIHSKIICDEQLRPSLSFNINDTKIQAKLTAQGKSFGYSAIAATAIAIHFGISKENIEKGLSSFAPDASEDYGRMLFEEIGTNIFINDCYNANPDSMLNALNVLSELKCKEGGKKIAVLGDMLELGKAAIAEHKEIICKALKVADIVFLYGKHFNDAFRQEDFFCKNNLNKAAQVFSNKSILSQDLKKTILENDIILVKASRGMKLEEVILELKK